MNKPEPILYLSDARGQYIPMNFAEDTKRECISGVTDAQLDLLAKGPIGGMHSADDASEHYWEVWNEVIDSAVITTGGRKYVIYQDGDCWLIPVGMEWDCKADWFVWPEEVAE